MYKGLEYCTILFILMIGCGYTTPSKRPFIQDVNGSHPADTNHIWLTHEHILVDFIGADSISPDRWSDEVVIPARTWILCDIQEKL